MASVTGLRQGLVDVSDLAVADLRLLRRAARSGDEFAVALMDVLPALIRDYGVQAAALAADWYDDRRDELNVAGSFTAIPVDFDDPGAHALVGWAAHTAKNDATLLSLLEGGVIRRVLNYGRETVRESALADPKADGWMRAGAGGCDFCRMLIGRGAVYTEETVRFAPHDNCRCVVVPAFGGRPLPVRLDADGKRLDVSTRRDRTDADLKAKSNAGVREWLAAHPDAG